MNLKHLLDDEQSKLVCTSRQHRKKCNGFWCAGGGVDSYFLMGGDSDINAKLKRTAGHPAVLIWEFNYDILLSYL